MSRHSRLLICLLPAFAFAQPDPTARAHALIAEAKQLVQANKLDEAYSRLTSAFQLEPSPETALLIIQVYPRNVGRNVGKSSGRAEAMDSGDFDGAAEGVHAVATQLPPGEGPTSGCGEGRSHRAGPC